MTYRAIGSLNRPSYLQTKSAEGEQEKIEAALRLLDVVLALPVIVATQRRDDLLEERINFAGHSGWNDER